MAFDVISNSYSLNEATGFKTGKLIPISTKSFKKLTDISIEKFKGLFWKISFSRVGSLSKTTHEVSVEFDSTDQNDKMIKRLSYILNKYKDRSTTKVEMKINTYTLNKDLVGCHFIVKITDKHARVFTKSLDFGLSNSKTSSLFKIFHLAIDKHGKDDVTVEPFEVLDKGVKIISLMKYIPTFIKFNLIRHYHSQLKLWLHIRLNKRITSSTVYTNVNIAHDLILGIYKKLTHVLSQYGDDHWEFTFTYPIFQSKFLPKLFFVRGGNLLKTENLYGVNDILRFKSSKYNKKKPNYDIRFYLCHFYRTLLYGFLGSRYLHIKNIESGIKADLKAIRSALINQNKVSKSNRWKTKGIPSSISPEDSYSLLSLYLDKAISDDNLSCEIEDLYKEFRDVLINKYQLLTIKSATDAMGETLTDWKK